MLSFEQYKSRWGKPTERSKETGPNNVSLSQLASKNKLPKLATNDSVNEVSYLPSLDGFRGVAILIVLIAHFGLGNYVPGGFGVMLFFFLSGFLITRLLMHEHAKTSSINLKRFYVRRFIRLYPPLLLMLIIFPAALIMFNHKVYWQELTAVLFYFENYYLYYFSGGHTVEGFFNIFWSLAVEEHFYIVYPIVFLIFFKKKNFQNILSLLILAAFLIRLYYVIRWESPLLTGYDDPSYEPTYMLSHCRFDSILFGCLSAVLIKNGNRFYHKLNNNYVVFALSLAVILITFILRNDAFRNSLRYTVQGLALMVIVPSVILYKKYEFLNRFLSSGWLVYIGKISYSLYVMHWVGIMLAGNLYPEEPTMYLDMLKPWPWYLASFSITLLLTFFSYYIVERKFLALRRKFGSLVK